MKLRPHHLLCTQGFEGKGYSQDFVTNMKKYVQLMRHDPGFEITLTETADDLCSHCPNLKCKLKDPDRTDTLYYSCVDDSKVIRFDKAVIKLFNLKPGETYNYLWLIKKINREMTEEKMRGICGDCSWFNNSACMKNVLGNKHSKIRIHGINTDDAGRCIHYHKQVDIAALKCAACSKYYACYECHDTLEDHPFSPTGEDEPYPVLCGICNSLLSKKEYETGQCPYCNSPFNPGCKTHCNIYFK